MDLDSLLTYTAYLFPFIITPVAIAIAFLLAKKEEKLKFIPVIVLFILTLITLVGYVFDVATLMDISSKIILTLLVSIIITTLLTLFVCLFNRPYKEREILDE